MLAYEAIIIGNSGSQSTEMAFMNALLEEYETARLIRCSHTTTAV